MSLRFEFRVVMSVTFPVEKRCSVRLYLQFVGRLMSCLRYLCLFAYSDVQHILCCVFVFWSSSCVPYFASYSELSMLAHLNNSPRVDMSLHSDTLS